QAPQPEPAASEHYDGPVAWLLSAKTEPALRDQAAHLLHHIETHPDLEPAAVARTLAARTMFTHRASIVGTTLDDFR
ncbi:hypothetical protein LKM28_35085, partial [Streptomyces sp. CT1-17]